jgi:alkylation response protein AidB-like acyl-CoA dehydrogenase
MDGIPESPRPTSDRALFAGQFPRTNRLRLVSAAREMVPVLGEHADEADRLGRLSNDVADALRAAGFLSLHVPLSLGGPEADFRTAFDVYTELGRGCGSSGWLAMVLSGASFMASLLGERARLEIWGEDPHAVVCSCTPAAGTARIVKGGLAVSGRWQPTSGVHHSEWAMVAVALEGETDADRDLTLALLPTGAGSTESTWDVTGLRATGSDTLVFDEVFVPEHLLLSRTRMLSGGYRKDHPDEPLSAAAVAPTLSLLLVAPLLGMGLAALEYARERLGDTTMSAESPTARRGRSRGVQYAVADAASLVDSARLLLLRALDDVEGGIARKTQPSSLVQARVQMDAATAAWNLRDAVRRIVTAMGSASFSNAHPLQRIWRDMEIALAHSNFSPDSNRGAYGRALLGISGVPTS